MELIAPTRISVGPVAGAGVGAGAGAGAGWAQAPKTRALAITTITKDIKNLFNIYLPLFIMKLNYSMLNFNKCSYPITPFPNSLVLVQPLPPRITTTKYLSSWQ
jgi:hypothetical protein